MKNVLVVEDSKAIRSMMRVSLEEAGFSVTEAGNGFEALKSLPTRHFRPDHHRHQHARHQRAGADQLCQVQSRL